MYFEVGLQMITYLQNLIRVEIENKTGISIDSL